MRFYARKRLGAGFADHLALYVESITCQTKPPDVALLQEPHIALLCLEVQTSLGVLGWEYFTDKGIQKGTKKSAKQTFRHEVRNPDPGRTAMVNCDFEKMTRCSVSRV